MNEPELIGLVGPVAATFIVSALAAVVPVVYVEVFIPIVVVLVPQDYPVWHLGVAAACGQMVGKSALYWGAAFAANIPTLHRLERGRLDGLRQRIATMSPLWVPGFTFASAFSGVPPFILFSVVAGAAKLPYGIFLFTGLAGRTLRMVTVAVGAGAFETAVLGE